MKAFEDLYREHVHAVYRFAMSVTGRREAAEDLTSEAFLALYSHLDSIDESRLPGWLLTVVRNRARDIWRHQEVEQRHAKEAVNPVTDGTPELERWMFDHADLKPVHRTCLLLRSVHGMSRTEIAETIGLSETQVKGHLQYGLSLLRKAYKKGSAE
jgi:RNA polymerase sigma factor (sigma-70 family)